MCKILNLSTIVNTPVCACATSCRHLQLQAANCNEIKLMSRQHVLNIDLIGIHNATNWWQATTGLYRWGYSCWWQKLINWVQTKYNKRNILFFCISSQNIIYISQCIKYMWHFIFLYRAFTAYLYRKTLQCLNYTISMLHIFTI